MKQMTIASRAAVYLASGALSASLVLAQTPPSNAQDAQKPKDLSKSAPTLPGGASQMQETHGDWRVTCAQQTDGKVCALSQQLADKDSRQLVVGIELKAMSSDKAEGTLVMPFGLLLAKAVTLQVDETGSPTSVPYRTCVPAGCLVMLNFDAATIASLKKGTVLNVKATADGGQEAAFKLSLKGFGSALDRTTALSK